MTGVFEEEPPARPVWLTTLADLGLLLVSFFVFLHANQMDGKALAASLRAGFGTPEAPAAMPVEMAFASGFARGSARPGDMRTALAWARAAAADPRTRLKITGEAGGGREDVDPATGSAAILAADRARAIAAALVSSGAVSPARLVIATATGERRATLTIGYEGDRQ